MAGHDRSSSVAEDQQQALLALLRVSVTERLDRVEAGWQAVQSGASPGTAAGLRHELGTVKSEAQAMKYEQLGRLLHKLEELWAHAESRQFHVPADFDMLVSMGVQFAQRMVRRPADDPPPGLDITGFTHQVDEALDALGLAPDQVRVVDEPLTLGLADDVRDRLAAAATSVFVASQAPGAHPALHGAWQTLVSELARLGEVPLRARLARLLDPVAESANALGKQVHTYLQVEDVHVRPAAAAATEALVKAILAHTVERAIEPPPERRAAGKPPAASVYVRAAQDKDALLFEVEDDGRGTNAGIQSNLAAARRVLTDLGGLVTVHHHEGRGTAVRFTLPYTNPTVDAWWIADGAPPLCMPAGPQPTLEDALRAAAVAHRTDVVAPRAVKLVRPCPTAASHPYEVGVVDGAEVLLLHAGAR